MLHKKASNPATAPNKLLTLVATAPPVNCAGAEAVPVPALLPTSNLGLLAGGGGMVPVPPLLLVLMLVLSLTFAFAAPAPALALTFVLVLVLVLVFLLSLAGGAAGGVGLEAMSVQEVE